MNLCYGLVVSPGRLFDLEISEFALYAAFCTEVEAESYKKSCYKAKELLSENIKYHKNIKIWEVLLAKYNHS